MANRDIGPGDNLHQYNLAFACKLVLPRVICGSIRWPILSAEADSAFPAMQVLAEGFAFSQAYNGVGAAAKEYALLLTMKNLIAPHLPVAEIFNEADSALWARAAARGFMIGVAGNNNLVRFTPEIYAQAKIDGDLRNAPSLPPTLAGYTINTDISAADCQVLLGWILPYLQPYESTINTIAFVAMFVGISKRGSITQEKLDKIIDGLYNEIQVRVAITDNLIQSVYTQFGRYVNEENAGDLFRRWSTGMTGVSLRMQITLSQTANAGLTAITAIKDAYVAFPNFNWPAIAHILRNDVAAATEAFRIIDGNAYYGFRRDLGPIASTKYKSLAYVAKELLLRYGGPAFGGLRYYAGWTRNPANQALLDDLIRTYNPVAADFDPNGEFDRTALDAMLVAAGVAVQNA